FDIDTSLEAVCDALRQGERLSQDHTFFREAQWNGSVLKVRSDNGYLAAAIVDFLRETLMERGDSFSFETVMSHRSKVEFFRRSRDVGYKTYLYFVCTTSADLNVARVRSRVGTGGHSVPEQKIRERYIRSLELAREARSHSYRAYFFDNSGRTPIWLAEFDPQGQCQLQVRESELPGWFRTWVLDP
ncbi:MAG: zeta toxin, partial [Planctomycetota bacterium]|nr:zeta toxin [Planctomycetota bacterium]